MLQEIFFEGQLEAIFYITRSELNIKKEYDFSSKIETEYVRKILQVFKEQTINTFWKDKISLNNKLLNLNKTEYFVWLLDCFLTEHQFENGYNVFNKLRIDMYEEELVWSNENGCKDYVYTLTDLSKTYYKMFLGCLLYSQNNKYLQKLIYPNATNQKIQELMDALNDGKIDVIRR